MIYFQIIVQVIIAVYAVRGMRIQRQNGDGHGQDIDIGVFFVLVVASYSILPLVGYGLALSGQGWIQDSRLGGALPEEGSVTYVGWLYILFSAGFLVTYSATTMVNPTWSKRVSFEQPSMRDVLVSALVFAALKALGVSLRVIFGVDSGFDYLDSYAVVSEQPLLVQQLIGTASSLGLAAAICSMVMLIAWRPSYHLVVAVFVVLLLAESILAGGQRRDAFLCGIAYVITRSIYGPKLTKRSVGALSVGGLGLFLLAGMLRQSEIDFEIVPDWAIFQSGEFLMVFNNAIDLENKAAIFRAQFDGLAFYLTDLFRLVPRQVIGDVKVDLSKTYVQTFYFDYATAGGGFAFGAIAESIVGAGLPEAALRGACLGVFYGSLRRIVSRPHLPVLSSFIYVWAVALCYEGLRDTTFTLLPRFVLQVLPIIVLVWIFGRFSVVRPVTDLKLQ